MRAAHAHARECVFAAGDDDIAGNHKISRAATHTRGMNMLG